MNKDRIMIVDVPFNINMSIICEENMQNHVVCKKLKATYEKAQTEEWIARRMALFMKYAGNSLIHQTNANFIGLVRYTKQSEHIIFKYLKQYPPLPSHIYFTTEANQIIEEEMKKHDTLFHIKIDSDNMYAPNFIEKLSAFSPEETTLTIMNQYGYIYEEKTRRIASVWYPSPSFSVSVYNKDNFKDLFAKRVFESHVRVLGRYKYEVLEGRNYMVCVHDQNVHNNFGRMYRSAQGKFLGEEERSEMLKAWHLN